MNEDMRLAEAQIIAHWRKHWEKASLAEGLPSSNETRLVDVVEEVCGSVQGKRVLEVGTGSGSIAVAFAQREGQVTIIDSAPKAVEHSLNRLGNLGYSVSGCIATASSLPFADDSFDFVVSGGLLEHFGSELRLEILFEMARVCQNAVVALIPNGANPFYRFAKQYLMATNAWLWDEEYSLISLRTDYEQAGLRVLEETSFDPETSIRLFESALKLDGIQTKALLDWSANEQDASLGYRLVTIGCV